MYSTLAVIQILKMQHLLSLTIKKKKDSVLVGRKRYPLLKYLYILMIVSAGVAMFIYKDGSKKGAQGGEGLIGVGEILLLLSLSR